MVLTIGVVIFTVLLVLVVASAAQLHLEHKRMLGLADLLALDAADALEDTTYFGHVGDARLRLTQEAAQHAVEDYLARHPDEARGWRDVRAHARPMADHTVEVTVTGRVLPGATAWVLAAWSDGITVDALSTAQAG